MNVEINSLPATGRSLAGPALSVDYVRSQVRPGIVASVIGGPAGSGDLRGSRRHDSPAQQAVEAALLKAVGLPLVGPTHSEQANSPADGVPGPTPGSPAYAAALRFTALPAAGRHAWLATHLAAVGADHISLASCRNARRRTRATRRRRTRATRRRPTPGTLGV